MEKMGECQKSKWRKRIERGRAKAVNTAFNTLTAKSPERPFNNGSCFF